MKENFFFLIHPSAEEDVWVNTIHKRRIYHTDTENYSKAVRSGATKNIFQEGELREKRLLQKLQQPLPTV